MVGFWGEDAAIERFNGHVNPPILHSEAYPTNGE